MTNQALHTPLSDYDYRMLGPDSRIVRAAAIEAGKAFECKSWGPEFAARVRVLPKPVAKPAPRSPIADADYEHLHPSDRIARGDAVRAGRKWRPNGYADAAFVRRVSIA